MGNWGIKSYENDEAADALDAGFERVHGELYDELMDDRNPLTFEQVQQRLADSHTLDAAIETLKNSLDQPGEPETWDELARLALSGIVVRHAELGVPIPELWKNRAIEWLENEEIEWDEATARRFHRRKEIALLQRTIPVKKTDSAAVEAPDPDRLREPNP
jgi:hypothetical protein